MKNYFYEEGKEATENFEEGMKALFKVPKEKVAKAAKKAKEKRAPRRQTARERENADKD
jgi:hypothetical protein